MNILGLDIGTTSICVIAIESESGSILESVTAPNSCMLQSDLSYERIQDAEKIYDTAVSLVDSFIDKYAPVKSIGITGQMHGILYMDENGKCLSPLYFWQDESGNCSYNENESFAEYLSSISGYKMATGYGGTTLFCHTKMNRIPIGSNKICTVHDYTGMRMCGLTEPLMHTSDAASLGLFNLTECSFDEDAIISAGMDFSLFPDVTEKICTIGKYKEIPVSVAIGDNQASFLGSVKDTEQSILVNFGTGSQISYLTPFLACSPITELRPCYDNLFLCVGSSLCGGRAFAILEEFLRKTTELVTGNICKSTYPAIDSLLSAIDAPPNPLDVSTRFCGTREMPSVRGYIKNIGEQNFTPEHLIYGILSGMINELRDMYESNPVSGNHTLLVGSGNGLRKNPALQKLISTAFSMELLIPVHSEEAAFGAALFGMTAAGFCDSIRAAQSIIKYTFVECQRI